MIASAMLGSSPPARAATSPFIRTYRAALALPNTWDRKAARVNAFARAGDGSVATVGGTAPERPGLPPDVRGCPRTARGRRQGAPRPRHPRPVAPGECRPQIVVLSLQRSRAPPAEPPLRFGRSASATNQSRCRPRNGSASPRAGGRAYCRTVSSSRYASSPSWSSTTSDFSTSARGGRGRRVPRDRLGRLQGPAAGEHREPAQQHALRLGQQVMAPVDQRPQGLLTGQRGATAAGEQPETVVEPGGDLLHGQHADPRRRQLDRQRDPVEPVEICDGWPHIRGSPRSLRAAVGPRDE